MGKFIMPNYAIVVLTDSAGPADNGRMVHAGYLSKELHEADHEVKLIFCGRGVTWVPAFLDRSNRFTENYHYLFDEARDRISVCNMCAKRFEVEAPIREGGIPIIGEGSDHIPLGDLVTKGYQIITF